MRSWLRVLGLLIIGLAVGAGLGLYLGWVAWPTEFTNANPSVLQERYQRDYILMIATVYSGDGDLAAARRRIDSLGENGHEALFSYTLDTILRAENEIEIRRLVRLAADIGLHSPAMDPYLTTAERETDNGS
jgi:hypothetical protein